MDKIQKFLISAGRKDLAQEYYEKVSASPLKTKVIEFANSITDWENAEIEDLEAMTKNLNNVKLWKELFNAPSLSNLELFLANEDIFEKYPKAKEAYKIASPDIKMEMLCKLYNIEYSNNANTAQIQYKYLQKHFPTSKADLLPTAKSLDGSVGDDDLPYETALKKHG